MNNNIKQMFSLVVTSLVVGVGVVHAADDMQMRNLENRVSALEQRRGSSGMINPPARPVVKDGADLWLEADALYMQATEDNLVFDAHSNPTLAYDNFRFKDASYDWSWGFRVGAGYNLPHDGWDLLANWTWFHSVRDHTDRALVGTDLIPAGAQPSLGSDAAETLSSAQQKLHLVLNFVDLELGREFFTSKWLTLRPLFGFRGAWVKRSLRETLSGDAVIHTKDWNRYQGFGPRAGLDSQWGLGGGWSFFGDFALSLIYGRQHINQIQSETSTLFDGDKHWTSLRAITDLAAGLRWDHLFSDGDYRIRLQAGWENHMIFGFNRNVAFPNSTIPAYSVAQSGDLGLNGVSFQARFDF